MQQMIINRFNFRFSVHIVIVIACTYNGPMDKGLGLSHRTGDVVGLRVVGLGVVGLGVVGLGVGVVDLRFNVNRTGSPESLIIRLSFKTR